MSDEQTENMKKDDAGGGNNAGSSQSEMINIIVKTSKERETFQISNNADIKQLRDLVSERYKVEPGKICLIFSGKILKDGDTLEHHKMKDGYIVHLVIRDASKQSSSTGAASTNTNTGTTSSTASSTANPASATPNPTAAGTGAAAGTGPNLFSNIGSMFMNLGPGNGGLDSLSQQLTQQMNFPEFMRQMLDSPVMQTLYTNPDIFRSIISNNPQIQQLIDRNPELNHVLQNPDIVRQTFEMMRNPAAFQELMRSHDRALSNLESLPGGYNALRRMYTELQEPMLNAAHEQLVGNPFATNTNNSGTGTGSGSGSTTPSNTENREPLPNPWQRSSNTAPTGGGSPSPAAAPGGNRPNMPLGNMFGTAMQQMVENPNLLQSLLSNPMMQSMMQQLASNPQMASQILQQPNLFDVPNAAGNAANPIAGVGPQPMELGRVLSAFDSLTRNQNNPLYQRIVGNLQGLQAYIQVETGLEQLERILGVPHSELLEFFANSHSGTAAGSQPTATSTTTSTPTSHTTSSPSSTTTASTGTTNTTPVVGASPPVAGGLPPGLNPNMLSQMMQQMFSGAPAENRFQAQLSQLEAMGFTNRQANLQALMETFGNLEAAIDRLLSRM